MGKRPIIVSRLNMELISLIGQAKREAASVGLPFYSTLPTILGVTHTTIGRWLRGIHRVDDRYDVEALVEIVQSYIAAIRRLASSKRLPIKHLPSPAKKRRSKQVFMTEYKKSFNARN